MFPEEREEKELRCKQLREEITRLSESLDKSQLFWANETLREIRKKAAVIREYRRDLLDTAINWYGPARNAEELYVKSIRAPCIYKKFGEVKNWKLGPWEKANDENWLKKDRHFQAFRIPFTVTNTWDMKLLYVGVFVPEKLDFTKPIGVHVKWHGGGFCTGSAFFEPHLNAFHFSHAEQNNAIILCPNHRLMPEATGSDILEDCGEFWNFYQNRSDEFGKFLDAIDERLRSKVAWKRLLVSGDSAGGFLAVYSWLKHAGPDLPIKVLLLQYPMLAYYTRKYPKSFDKNTPEELNYLEWYGCKTYSKHFPGRDPSSMLHEKIKEKTKRVMEEVEHQKELGQIPTRVESIPPLYSFAGFGLAAEGKWKEVFQGNQATKDIIDMVKDSNIEPNYFPSIFMYHGTADINCPIQHVVEFEKLCKQRWKENFLGKNPELPKMVFERVESLESEQGAVGHGFDHSIKVEEEKWLETILCKVSEAWALER